MGKRKLYNGTTFPEQIPESVGVNPITIMNELKKGCIRGSISMELISQKEELTVKDLIIHHLAILHALEEGFAERRQILMDYIEEHKK